MDEYKHYSVVREWLASKGYRTYERVRFRGYEFDVVGENGSLVVIEVKETFFKRLVRQALRRKKLGIFSKIYVAYPFRKFPRVGWLKRHGIGVIDLSELRELLPAKEQRVERAKAEEFALHLRAIDGVKIEAVLEKEDYLLLKHRLKKLGFNSVQELLEKLARYEAEIVYRYPEAKASGVTKLARV